MWVVTWHQTQFDAALSLPEESGEDDDRKPAAVQSGDTVLEPICKNRPELLQTLRQKHLDDQLTVSIVKEISTNASSHTLSLVSIQGLHVIGDYAIVVALSEV